MRKFIAVPVLLLFVSLLHAQSQKPLSLVDELYKEGKRRTDHAAATKQANQAGDQLGVNQLLNQHVAERAKLRGKLVEGQVEVFETGEAHGDAPGTNYRYVKIRADSGSPEIFEAIAYSFQDPLLPKLKKGDKLIVRGYFDNSIRVEKLLYCTFARPKP